ncbi:MAG: Inositol 2-dehydrogenase/D-chiro-inositol 3-dehydrogenase [Phycisphaerae bacterium]|nr:Inositol 2-dehydrogenase/D-chiro-inositol 3-dehydrogenase [Phycisphaerae bacterium]
MSRPLNVGVVGVGNISGAYFKGTRPYEVIRVTACADLLADRSGRAAAEHGLRALSVDALLADKSIDIVLNLTIPAAHAQVNQAAIAAGKHVYCEKPFALNNADAAATLRAARAAGVRVGCAPDTFLGAGGQTARGLIDAGAIGQPVAAMAFFTCRGHERWHPAPEFYYKVGGGPMLDMGPYYITGLVNLLGPARAVIGSAVKSFPTRTITSEPLKGKVVDVEVNTHVAGNIEFANGAVATIVTSFDLWEATLPRIEVHGSEGSLSVPDPNHFMGPVKLFKAWTKQWEDIPLTHSDRVLRGIGVADLAAGVLGNRPHRASGELAAHVLEIMTAFDASQQSGRRIELKTTCTPPAPLPPGLPVGQLD